MPTDQRIFFDITATLQFIWAQDCYSGMQRVVVMMIYQIARLVDPRRTFLCYVSRLDGKMRCICLDAIDRESLLDLTFPPRSRAIQKGSLFL